MKLTQIALRNFRSGQNLTLDLNAPRVYICGRNGVGKSSIKDAIRWVLRGVCQSTDAKGQGWEELIPEGTTVLSAGVVLDGIGGVERTYKEGKRTLQLEGRDNDMSSSQNAIYQLLNTTPEFLDAALETSYFLDLHHAEAKAMVLGLLNVQIPVGQEMLTLLQVESRYKTAFADRTLAKARQKAHVVPPFTIPAEGLMAKPEDIKGLLDSLRVEFQTLVSQSGASAGRRAVLEQQLAAQKAKPELFIPDRIPMPAEIQALQMGVEDLESAFEVAQKALEARHTAPQTTKSEPEDSGAIRERIAVLSAHRPTKGCVLDANVSCDTARLKFTNQVKVYKGQLEALPAAEPVEPEAPLPFFDHMELVTARQNLAEARKLQESSVKALRHNQERQEEIDALTAQLRSLDAGPAVVDHSTAIDTLKARIAKGEKVLEHATEFWRQHKAHEVALQAKATLDGQVNQLEMLCELLGPNGARVEALAKAIGAFEERINATTQAFGWTVAFELDPWTVRVNGRTLDAYSESEAFRIGIAIQIAVAVTSGLGFLVVDRLDMLDVDNRGVVTKMLLGHTEEIQQVIILATREIGQPLPAIPGVKAVRLAKDGLKTVVVEQNALAEMVA